MHVQGLGRPLLISRLSTLGTNLTTQAVRIGSEGSSTTGLRRAAYRYIASIALVAAAPVSLLRDGLSLLARFLFADRTSTVCA